MVTEIEPQTNAESFEPPPIGWKSRISQTRFQIIEHIEVTESTNSDLLLRASDSGITGDVVRIADYQTAGRGRLDRIWDAPPRTNLLFSALLYPNWADDRHSLVTVALSLSVVEILRIRGIEAAIKWPNDIVIESGPVPGKLGGILAEYVSDPVSVVIVGLGFNLTWPNLDDVAPQGSTSLKVCGHDIDRWDLLADVLNAFELRLTEMVSVDGPELLRKQQLMYSATVDRMVMVETLNDSVIGKAVDISADGSLTVHVTSSGGSTRPIVVTVADVTHLRAV